MQNEPPCHIAINYFCPTTVSKFLHSRLCHPRPAMSSSSSSASPPYDAPAGGMPRNALAQEGRPERVNLCRPPATTGSEMRLDIPRCPKPSAARPVPSPVPPTSSNLLKATSPGTAACSAASTGDVEALFKEEWGTAHGSCGGLQSQRLRQIVVEVIRLCVALEVCDGERGSHSLAKQVWVILAYAPFGRRSIKSRQSVTQ